MDSARLQGYDFALAGRVKGYAEIIDLLHKTGLSQGNRKNLKVPA